MKRTCGCGGEVKREGRGCRRVFVCQTCRKPARVVYRRREQAAAEQARRDQRKRKRTQRVGQLQFGAAFRAAVGAAVHGARPKKGAAHQARRRWVVGIDWASGPDRMFYGMFDCAGNMRVVEVGGR